MLHFLLQHSFENCYGTFFCYGTVFKIATARFFATAQFSKLLQHTFFATARFWKLLQHSFQVFFSALVFWSDLISAFFGEGFLNENGQKFWSVNNWFHEIAGRLLYNNVNTQLRSCLRSWKYGSLVPNLASLVALWADSSPLVMPDLALVTRIFYYATPSALRIYTIHHGWYA